MMRQKFKKRNRAEAAVAVAVCASKVFLSQVLTLLPDPDVRNSFAPNASCPMQFVWQCRLSSRSYMAMVPMLVRWFGGWGRNVTDAGRRMPTSNENFKSFRVWQGRQRQR